MATPTTASIATQNVYVVLENGELYTSLYYSYDDAREAVTTKYAEELAKEMELVRELREGFFMSSKVDVAENKETGTTQLYIEKEIYTTIQRYKLGVSP